MKKKIAIIIDKEGWAFDNAAKQIKTNLSNDYLIDIIPMELFGDNVIKLLFLCTEYDLIFFMWRGFLSWLYSDFSKYYISKLGFEYEEFLEKYVKNRNIVTAIYDHLYLNIETERTDFILNHVKSYIVCSEKLKQIYHQYPNHKKPEMVISDGVDLSLFKRNNPYKYNDLENRAIRIRMDRK